MSRREWERGDVTFPTAAWAGFKKAIRDGIAAAVKEDLETVTRMVAALKLANKGKRGLNWATVIDEALRETTPGGYSVGFGYRGDEPKWPLKVLNAWDVAGRGRLLVTEEGKLGPLQKKFLPAFDRKTTSFSADTGTLTFVDSTRKAVWDVDESNRACEQARESFVGTLFFDQMKKVKFTRGTGGSIWGSDEYRDDANREHAGGSAHELKDRFGPLGEQEWESRYAGIRGMRRGSGRR